MSALDPLRWSRRLDAIFPWVLVGVSPAYRDVFLLSKTSVAAMALLYHCYGLSSSPTGATVFTPQVVSM